MKYFAPLFVLLFTTLSACSTNPVTGKSELSLLSPAQEVSIGEQNYGPYQQQQGGAYAVDPELTLYVREVGMALARVSDRPGLPYDFVDLNRKWATLLLVRQSLASKIRLSSQTSGESIYEIFNGLFNAFDVNGVSCMRRQNAKDV